MSRKRTVTPAAASSASAGLDSVNRPSTSSDPPAGGATARPGRTHDTAYPFSSSPLSNSPRSGPGNSALPAPSYKATRAGGVDEVRFDMGYNFSRR